MISQLPDARIVSAELNPTTTTDFFASRTRKNALMLGRLPALELRKGPAGISGRGANPKESRGIVLSVPPTHVGGITKVVPTVRCRRRGAGGGAVFLGHFAAVDHAASVHAFPGISWGWYLWGMPGQASVSRFAGVSLGGISRVVQEVPTAKPPLKNPAFFSCHLGLRSTGVPSQTNSAPRIRRTIADSCQRKKESRRIISSVPYGMQGRNSKKVLIALFESSPTYPLGFSRQKLPVAGSILCRNGSIRSTEK